MRRLHEGLAKWGVTLVDPVFVEESKLTFEREVVLCRQESLYGLDDDRWDGLLENNKAWLNASLLTSKADRHVLSIHPGPTVAMMEEMEFSVNLVWRGGH